MELANSLVATFRLVAEEIKAACGQQVCELVFTLPGREFPVKVELRYPLSAGICDTTTPEAIALYGYEWKIGMGWKLDEHWPITLRRLDYRIKALEEFGVDKLRNLAEATLLS
jgi:hypothetical protein